MRPLKNDLDRYNYERVQLGEFHPGSSLRPTLLALLDRTNTIVAMRKPQPSDLVLKCLHRDDPLRHTYLRRRWRAT